MPSQTVIADPEDLERFARELKRFNDQLKNSRYRLQGQFNRLGETWKDSEHRRFAEEFRETMEKLNQFQRISEKQIPELWRKARKLRDFHRR